MTDTNAASTSEKIFCPKEQMLQRLLEATFWEHLHASDYWIAEIKEALHQATKDALEQDNFALQEETLLSRKIIAEQEIKIRHLMDAVEYQRKRVGEAKDALNKAFDSLGQINGRTYGGW